MGTSANSVVFLFWASFSVFTTDSLPTDAWISGRHQRQRMITRNVAGSSFMRIFFFTLLILSLFVSVLLCNYGISERVFYVFIIHKQWNYTLLLIPLRPLISFSLRYIHLPFLERSRYGSLLLLLLYKCRCQLNDFFPSRPDCCIPFLTMFQLLTTRAMSFFVTSFLLRFY